MDDRADKSTPVPNDTSWQARIKWAAAHAETRQGLLCLFAGGLFVRVFLAFVSEGLAFDMALFRLWATRLAEGGLWGFYSAGTEYVVDYPPGYLYVLMLLGTTSRALLDAAPPAPLLKLPAIFADIGLAALVMLMTSRVTRGANRTVLPIRALGAMAILANPAFILISAVWGQVDSLLAVLVFATVYLLAGRATVLHECGAAALLCVATLTKPQAVFAFPAVAVFLFWRHAPHIQTLMARLILCAVVGAAVAVVMFLPFGMTPIRAFDFFRNAGSLYSFTSLWAFNTWGAVGFYQPDIGPEAVAIGGVAAMYVGVVAFAVLTVFIVRRTWQALASGIDPHAVLLFAIAAVTCCGFAVLTRMHERYLYLAVATLAPFIGRTKLGAAFVVLSAAFLINVHFVYVLHSHAAVPPGGAWTIAPVYDSLFGEGTDAVQRKVLSVIIAGACLVIAIRGWAWLRGDDRAAPQVLVAVHGFRIDRQP